MRGGDGDDDDDERGGVEWGGPLAECKCRSLMTALQTVKHWLSKEQGRGGKRGGGRGGTTGVPKCKCARTILAHAKGKVATEPGSVASEIGSANQLARRNAIRVA